VEQIGSEQQSEESPHLQRVYSSYKHWICVHNQIMPTQQQQHPFKGPLSRTTRVCRYQKGKINLDFKWSERQWVAVASAVPYASLHLTPDR